MQTKKNQRNPYANATPGFAIKIEKTTDLGIGMLVAEFSPRNAGETFRYEPIGPVATIEEAYEVADSNLKQRPHATYPDRYIVWAAGLLGEYRVAHTIVF